MNKLAVIKELRRRRRESKTCLQELRSILRAIQKGQECPIEEVMEDRNEEKCTFSTFP